MASKDAAILLVVALSVSCGSEGSQGAGGPTGGSGSGGTNSGGTNSGGTDSGGTDSGGTNPGGTDSGGTAGSGNTAGTSGSAGSGRSDDPCPAGGVQCNGACLEPGGMQGNCLVLARASGQILDVAIDAEHAYLATVDGVARLPKAGGPVEVLVETSDSTRAIAVNSTAVFWSEEGFRSSVLMTMPKSGGVSMQLDTHSESIRPIRANESRVFYLKEQFFGADSVTSVAVAGGSSVTHGLSDSSLGSPAIDDTHVYWGDNPFSEDSHLFRSPHETAAAEQLVTFDTVYFPIPIGSEIYFNESLANGLHRVPKAGGTVSLVLRPSPQRSLNPLIFANTTHIFWVSPSGVMRAALDGASPEPVVELEVAHSAVADASHLYLVSWDYLVQVSL